ncbi:MAG: hypothetical protein UHD09_07100 [Bifidobacterium sp.]|nr:hypothetical protein [Bifidobacterium sp.]
MDANGDEWMVDLDLVKHYRNTLEAHVRPNPDTAWLVLTDPEPILADDGTMVCTIMRAERLRRNGRDRWRTTGSVGVDLTPEELDRGDWILAARDQWSDDLDSSGPTEVNSDDRLMWRDWRWSVQSCDWIDASIDLDDETGMIAWALMKDADTGWLYAHLMRYDSSLDRWRAEWGTPLPVDRDYWLAEAKAIYETCWKEAFDNAEAHGIAGAAR